jgi:uncharacterized membrane protein YuzA (DUF378 family)
MTLPADFTTTLVGFLLTLLVMSYLLGDTPLFKIAIYIFVGVSAGYAVSVVWHQALLPALFVPLLSFSGPERFLLVIPLVLGVLLLMKISPYLSRLGTLSMAFLVGVGAAVAIGGAMLGTLLPQMGAAIAPFDMTTALPGGFDSYVERMVMGILALVGTVSTLVYFHFGAKTGRDGKLRRSRVVELLAWVGRIFIAITFGVLFAGVYAAALSAFIDRLDSIISFFR